MKTNPLKLIVSIAICQGAGIVGSISNASSLNTWYETLTKPVFNPPGWIFGPVWITLYILMGISLYLVWNSDIKKKVIPITAFIIQLILNTAWSILFFTMQNPFYAFIDIIALLVFIFITIILFWRISKTASALLFPYIAWVAFAAILNYSIWQLNI